MKRLKLLVLCFFVGIGLAFAQNTRVTGIVTDGNGEPVIGASVVVKGNATIGTVTNLDGKFSLDVPSTAKTLVVKYLGMQDHEVAVAPEISVKMKTSDTSLDEVIVVAYGTAKKSAFTGSATQISGETLTKKNQSEITKALAGEVAGVQVINSSGQPGTNAKIRIRGFGSANSSREPLYVVDGMPYDGDISAIDASDIESTTVLKDAAAAALYGARASNGVILITTKKGKNGTSYIDVDVKAGVNVRLIPLYEVIDSPERFTELSWEALRNYGMLQNGLKPAAAGVYASNNLFNTARGMAPIYNMWNTDGNTVIDPASGRFSGAARKYTPEKWSDYMFDTGEKQEASLRFSGGMDKLSYYTSFGGLKEKGYYIGSDFSRLNARTNLNYQPKSWLKATTNLSYSYMDQNHPSQTDNMNNGFQFVNYMPPIYPVYQRDAQGNMISDPVVGGHRYDFGMEPGYERGYASGINPVGTVNLDTRNRIFHQFIGNANFEIMFLKDFKFTSSNGYTYLYYTDTDLTNPYYGDAKGLGRISREHISYLALTNTQMLSYLKDIDRHTITAFVAHESQNLTIRDDYAAKNKMAKADNLEFNNAIVMQDIAGYTLGRSMESYFAQVKYDYDEKYFADINFRRDGSSRFSKYKWGNFWSAGAAWVINKEEFMSDLNFINHLRLKASYGTYGNEYLDINGDNAYDSNVNYYPTQNLYNVRNLNDQITYSLYYQGNPDLTWEKSNMFNTGLDFGLWDDRLEGEIEFFQKRTTDMLFNIQLPTSVGLASMAKNDAELRNTGIEFTLKGKIIKTSDWEVSLKANGTHYTNRMTTMPHDGFFNSEKIKDIEVHGSYGWSKGHSLYDFYMRDFAGVDPSTGQSQWYVYYDKNNPVLDANNNPTDNYTRIDNMVQYLADRAALNKTVDLDEQKTTAYSTATLKYIGKSVIPDLTGSFGFEVNYKGIELSAQFLYNLGGYGYDGVYATLMHNANVGTNNWHKDIEQRWTAAGQETVVPRLSATYDTYVNSASSRFLTSRNYLGLNNVRLAYTFPKRLMDQLKMQKTTVWVSGDNLFLTTARKGYYPVGSEAGDSDRSRYIPLSTIMGGLSVQF